MNNKRLLLQVVSLFLIVLVSVACGNPKVVNHPRPDLTVNTDWLETAGCTPREGLSGLWDCRYRSPLVTLGCEHITIFDLLGGLSPSHPLVICANDSGKIGNSTKFRKGGCIMPSFSSQLLFKDDAYQLVSGAAELQTVFAPVESRDEALSYALAATNLYARYGQQIHQYFRYHVNALEDTHVDEVTDGYVVHLFTPAQPECGCGVHTVYAVDVLVTREGQVQETKSQPIYEFSACID
jgi:hypothetical protein